MKGRRLLGALTGLLLAASAAAPAAGHTHDSYQPSRKLLGADRKTPLQIPDMHRSCGHVPPSAEERLQQRVALAPFMVQKPVRRRNLQAAGIVIRTFWHVNRLGGAPPDPERKHPPRNLHRKVFECAGTCTGWLQTFLSPQRYSAPAYCVHPPARLFPAALVRLCLMHCASNRAPGTGVWH